MNDKRILDIVTTLAGMYDVDMAIRDGQHAPNDLFLQVLTAIRQEYSCFGADSDRVRQAIALLADAYELMHRVER